MAHMLRLTPCHSLTALPLHAVPRLYVLRLFVQCAQFERPDPNVSSTVLRHFGKRLFRLLCLSAIVIHFACFVRCSLRGHQRHGVPAVGLPPAVLRLDLALLRRVGGTRHPRLSHWFVLAQQGFRLLARSLADRRASQAFRPSSCSCCSTTASAEANRRCNSKSDSSTSVRAFCSICLNPLNLSRVCCL